MVTDILLLVIVIILAGVLASIKKGFNEVIKGLEAIERTGNKG